MGYNWAQLAFVERWRLHSIRGTLIAAQRHAEHTYFELRVQASDHRLSSPGTFVDILCLDVGDIIREKRICLTDRVAVIVRPLALSIMRTDRRDKVFVLQPAQQAAKLPNARRLLGIGATVAGQVLESDGERNLLVDVGFTTVVGVLDAEAFAQVSPGDWIEFTNQMPAQGYIIAG